MEYKNKVAHRLDDIWDAPLRFLFMVKITQFHSSLAVLDAATAI